METKKEPIRVVFLGKTGSGKSSCCNTILGNERFKATPGSGSVTEITQSAKTVRYGDEVHLVDTPGLFSFDLSPYYFLRELVNAVNILRPGPHAFAIVFKGPRISQEDYKVVDELEKIYTEAFCKYCIIIVTRWDEIQSEYASLKEWAKSNAILKKLFKRFDNRVIAFNNKCQNTEQIQDFLEVIKKMKEDKKKSNSLSCFSLGKCDVIEDAYRQKDVEMKKQCDEECEKLRNELSWLSQDERMNCCKAFGVLFRSRAALRFTNETLLEKRQNIVKVLEISLEENGKLSPTLKAMTTAVSSAVIVGAGVGVGIVLAPITLAVSAIAAVSVLSGAAASITAGTVTYKFAQNEEFIKQQIDTLQTLAKEESIHAGLYEEEINTLAGRVENSLVNLTEDEDLEDGNKLLLIRDTRFGKLLKQITYNPDATIKDPQTKLKVEPASIGKVSITISENIGQIAKANQADADQFWRNVSFTLKYVCEDFEQIKQMYEHICKDN